MASAATAQQVNKVALITGSTSGLGLGIAKRLAKNNIDIIMSGFGSPEIIAKLKEEIRGSRNIRVEYVNCDLRKKDQIENMCEEIIALFPDGIDILVNNAGFNYVESIDDYPDHMWDDLIAVMMSAAFHLIKRLVKDMKRKKWGRIVSMSSQMGLISAPGKAVYSACKAGLIGFTKGVALDFAEDNITANCVCPTWVLTPLVDGQIREMAAMEGLTYQKVLEEYFLQDVPTKRLPKIDQVAELVEFLILSGSSSEMTGGAYLIDGGFTAR